MGVGQKVILEMLSLLWWCLGCDVDVAGMAETAEEVVVEGWPAGWIQYHGCDGAECVIDRSAHVRILGVFRLWFSCQELLFCYGAAFSLCEGKN